MPDAGIELRRPDGVRTQRFNLRRERFIQSLNYRDHENDRNHAHAHAQDRQRRAQLIRAHRIERHECRFANVEEGHGYSALRASIGSKRAARHAGQRPLMTPTIDDTPTPRTADQMLNNNGNPIARAISQAVPNPVSTPKAPPIAVTITASMRNCVRMSLRRAPTALRMPISLVRSVTDTSMMFMTTMPPTTSEIAATPIVTR